ncbi:MAG: GNAT family N-acetyltransferase [bacterium]
MADDLGLAVIRIRRACAIDPILLTGLGASLVDAIESGASVGFLAPLERDTAFRYWAQVSASLGHGLVLWVAEEGREVVGSVQLALCERENARHRAEVQKLFVLRSARGIASRSMETAEGHARVAGRTLLVLDTQAGSAAESVYDHLGWKRVGEVPAYAAALDGALRATAYYYKELR